jgi:hypothetical protein
MSFLFQSLLTIGIPLIGLPLLIHLINLRRHRRIEWAAMDFLLESQKRNRKWIVLKQLLLLLLRTAAVALVVFMLAGPVIKSGWAGLFGRGVTHHLILLDDSYSMADHWNETSAFQQARQAVMRILDQARGQADSQVVTLLTFSEAKKLSAGQSPAIDRRALDARFMAELEKTLGEMKPSESNAGPIEALQAATRLPEPALDETRIAYIVTDFRRAQWDEQSELRQLVGRLREGVARLLMVQSVYAQRPNLAITRLEPESGIRASGVETWMDLIVANYSDTPASAITVAVEQDGARLPAVQIDDIPANEEATRRFRVTFPTAGAHQLKASLESDAVDTDNVCYFAADIPATFPVLVIDGSPDGDDGYFMRNALSPGGKNLAGWTPQVEPASYLRRHEELARFAAICLLDVPRLDDPEVAALEDYVKSGGGLAVFLGSESQRPFYNDRLYKEGQGLLPAPLNVPSQLLRESGEASPDAQVTDHPIFRVFAGQRNSFLQVAKVNFYYALDPQWSPPANGDVKVIAKLRNGAPLSVEKKLGKGRVIMQLLKLSPKEDATKRVWSNWAVNPVFPVFANELVGYLSAARRRYEVHRNDEPVQITVPEGAYQPEVRVRAPVVSQNEATVGAPAAKDGVVTIAAPGTPHSGVYEFELKTRDGKTESRYAAVTVPAGEGRLKFISRDELADRLPGIDYQYSLASEFSDTAQDLAGVKLADALLYTLAGVLILEQLFAVSASYHPSSPRRAA